MQEKPGVKPLNKRFHTLLPASLALAAGMLLAACGSEEPDEPATEPQPEPQAEAEPRRDPNRVQRQNTTRDKIGPSPDSFDQDRQELLPRVTGQQQEEGYGLTMVVDGSSPEAFHQSLQWIAEDTSEEQYQKLASAVRYLRMYSSVAQESHAALYESLDGMTGEQIIERGEEIVERRRSGG